MTLVGDKIVLGNPNLQSNGVICQLAPKSDKIKTVSKNWGNKNIEEINAEIKNNKSANTKKTREYIKDQKNNLHS